MAKLQYQTGFNNEHETEALAGALPMGQFSPQKVKYNLYAEQLSTTAFTAPRASNRRSWTYRLRPSVVMSDFEPVALGNIVTAPHATPCPPNAMRWSPFPFADEPTDFVTGLTTLAANGSAHTHIGMAIHLYSANANMKNKVFYNADGELLIVPQHGEMLIKTEFGRLSLEPEEIAVIPRGVKFSINVISKHCRGYVCENYGQPFTLPERGLVGANGYANQRDFLYPVAWFEDNDSPHTLVTKFDGQLYQAALGHSPFDVVAWVGNSAPYKYNLNAFNVINSVSFDHPDPSIFTVLTSPSAHEGTANVDFVIFPERWMVAEHTFRPPYYHRNMMSEFMGLIKGTYDAKEEGFEPGGASLHNCMTPHGPEAAVFDKATSDTLTPQRYTDTLAFMLESSLVIKPTPFALKSPCRQTSYANCWKGLKKQFTGEPQ